MGSTYVPAGLDQHAAGLHLMAVVIVHFFIGYRRTGDIHEIVKHRIGEEGLHIFVLSVDLCMQRETADLAFQKSF